MGLLQKAQSNAAPPTTIERLKEPRRGFLDRAASLRSVDNIEQLCVDRLRRLDSGTGTPYAALTILKAYYPSIAEIILKKIDNEFHVLNSIGISENTCSDENIRLSSLVSPLPSAGYCSFSASELGIECLPSDSKAVAFPLSVVENSIDGFLVLIVNEKELASAASILRIAKSFPRKFITTPEIEQLKKSETHRTSSIVDEAAFADIFSRFGSAHILIYKLNKSSLSLIESATELAAARVGSLGKAILIHPDKIAVFLKSTLDKELYAHQLLKSFRNSLPLKADELTLEREEYATDQQAALAIINR